MLTKRLFNGLVILLAAIGAIFSFWFVLGLAQDIATGDETTGGYDYPYTGWQGTPINYEDWYATNDGLFHDGRIADQILNCTTGKLVFSVLSTITIDFRALSDRAKVVHQPQIRCRALGFDTSAWDAIDDPEGLYTNLASPTTTP